MAESIDIQVKRISAKLRKLGESIPREVQTELYVGGLQIEETAKRSIQSGDKSGRIYQKYNPRRTHKASAAGQAPASDTGALVNSIRTERVDKGADVKAGGGATDYAVHLEFGTSTILPRPYMQPALEQNRKEIFKNVERELNKVINRDVK